MNNTKLIEAQYLSVGDRLVSGGSAMKERIQKLEEGLKDIVQDLQSARTDGTFHTIKDAQFTAEKLLNP